MSFQRRLGVISCGAVVIWTRQLTSPRRALAQTDIRVSSKGVQVPRGVELNARDGGGELEEERKERQEGKHAGH
jgi:hypothetical protein